MTEQAFGPPPSRPATTLQLLIPNRSSRPDLALPEDTSGPRPVAIREATVAPTPDGLRVAIIPKRGQPAARRGARRDVLGLTWF